MGIRFSFEVDLDDDGGMLTGEIELDETLSPQAFMDWMDDQEPPEFRIVGIETEGFAVDDVVSLGIGGERFVADVVAVISDWEVGELTIYDIRKADE